MSYTTDFEKKWLLFSNTEKNRFRPSKIVENKPNVLKVAMPPDR